MDSLSSLDAERIALEQAIQHHLGPEYRVGGVRAPTVGGSSRTLIFDCHLQPDSAERLNASKTSVHRTLVSRQETYRAPNTPFLDSHRQLLLIQLALANGLKVPTPVFEYDGNDRMGEGFVTEFLHGETFPKILQSAPEYEHARRHLVEDCAVQLAKLHAIPANTVLWLEDRPDSADPIDAQRARLDSYGEAHPAVEAGLRWLERNRPTPRAPVLVHGDFRCGNLIVDRNGLAAILDWECCHLGSPAEDLGWFCSRPWRFHRPDRHAGGFASRESLLQAYANAGGRRISTDEVRYWEVFAMVRWAILNVMQAHGHVVGGRPGLVFAACGRNAAMVEYDLIKTLAGEYD